VPAGATPAWNRSASSGCPGAASFLPFFFRCTTRSGVRLEPRPLRATTAWPWLAACPQRTPSTPEVPAFPDLSYFLPRSTAGTARAPLPLNELRQEDVFAKGFGPPCPTSRPETASRIARLGPRTTPPPAWGTARSSRCVPSRGGSPGPHRLASRPPLVHPPLCSLASLRGGWPKLYFPRGEHPAKGRPLSRGVMVPTQWRLSLTLNLGVFASPPSAVLFKPAGPIPARPRASRSLSGGPDVLTVFRWIDRPGRVRRALPHLARRPFVAHAGGMLPSLTVPAASPVLAPQACHTFWLFACKTAFNLREFTCVWPCRRPRATRPAALGANSMTTLPCAAFRWGPSGPGYLSEVFNTISLPSSRFPPPPPPFFPPLPPPYGHGFLDQPVCPTEGGPGH